MAVAAGLIRAVAVIVPLIAAAPPVVAGDSVAWFRSTTQALVDAYATGDRGVWGRVLDRDCTITTEDGEVQNRSQFLDQLHPLPSGFTGSIRVRDLTVREVGTAAVVHYWMDETETIFGQQLKTLYVDTDVYRRADQSWKMVAAQTTVVPRDMDPIQVDTSGWPALVGDYRLSAAATSRYRVFMRDGALYAGKDAKTATLLIPLAPQVFHQKGSIHIMVFVKDKAGAVTEVRELHKYNEVRMQRITDAAR
jgi:hypothetical protein